MIAAQRQLHDIARNDGTIPDYRHLLDSAYGQDTGIGRIDDRRELFHSEHTHIGNRESAAFPVGWLKLSGFGPSGEVFYFGGYLGQ
jgi:hypothetical protein